MVSHAEWRRGSGFRASVCTQGVETFTQVVESRRWHKSISASQELHSHHAQVHFQLWQSSSCIVCTTRDMKSTLEGIGKCPTSYWIPRGVGSFSWFWRFLKWTITSGNGCSSSWRLRWSWHNFTCRLSQHSFRFAHHRIGQYNNLVWSRYDSKQPDHTHELHTTLLYAMLTRRIAVTHTHMQQSSSGLCRATTF